MTIDNTKYRMVRIDKPLTDKLKVLANEHNRSMAGEIHQVLQDYVSKQEIQSAREGK